MEIVAAIVVGAVFGSAIVCQVTGRGPELWAIFGLGAVAVVASGTLSLGLAANAAVGAFPIIGFLLALFVLTAALDRSGAVDHFARWLVGRTRSPRDLPLVLFLGIGLVSALVVNDALVLIGVPVLIAVAVRLRADPRPLLLVLAYAVTVGSTLLPWGNPQNLLVAYSSGLAFPLVVFVRYLALPTAVNLVVGALFLRWVYRDRLPAEGDPAGPHDVDRARLFPPGDWARRVTDQPVLVLLPATLAALVGTDLASAAFGTPEIASWAIALAGAGVTLLLSSHRWRTVREVQWPILLLFLGLFVVVAGAVQGGVISAVEGYFPIPGPGDSHAGVVAIVGTSLLGSQVVSNVPWTALQLPVLHGVGYGSGTPLAWMALAAGSTLAGNLTLIGAASNLIVVGAARQRGVRLSLRDFVRTGLPLAGLTVAVLLGCLWVGW